LWFIDDHVSSENFYGEPMSSKISMSPYLAHDGLGVKMEDSSVIDEQSII